MAAAFALMVAKSMLSTIAALTTFSQLRAHAAARAASASPGDGQSGEGSTRGRQGLLRRRWRGVDAHIAGLGAVVLDLVIFADRAVVNILLRLRLGFARRLVVDRIQHLQAQQWVRAALKPSRLASRFASGHAC